MPHTVSSSGRQEKSQTDIAQILSVVDELRAHGFEISWCGETAPNCGGNWMISRNEMIELFFRDRRKFCARLEGVSAEALQEFIDRDERCTEIKTNGKRCNGRVIGADRCHSPRHWFALSDGQRSLCHYHARIVE